ncbi:MAG TPA: hypothetical protein VHO48_04480 [Anaerolineaceae bacterium]|nr:hypothetical protein [Anaerolineaceae bacterium]
MIAGLPVAGLLLMAVYFVSPLLDLLRGHEFLPYAKGIYLMAVFYGLWYAYWPLQTALKAVRLSKPIFIANLLAIGSMFTIGVWAIQNWGVYGTIAGQALNALIINIVLWTAWRRECRKDQG